MDPGFCDNIVTMGKLAQGTLDRSKQVWYNIRESKHYSFKDYEVDKAV